MESLLGPGSKLLRHNIEKENPSLANELEALWISALKKIHEFQEGKTIQGTLHCLIVENNIGLLLQDKISKFKDIDIFVLSASAALHDIGKIRRQDNDKTEDHGLDGKKILLSPEVWPVFFHDYRKAEAVANIIGVHDNGNFQELPEEEFVIDSPPGVLLRSLTAIFRLADMLDTTYTRTPYILRKIKAMKFVESPEIHLGRGSIGGWKIHNDGITVLLQKIHDLSEDEEKAMLTCVDLLNDSITDSHRKYLENCPVLYWKQRGKLWSKASIEKDTLHFPFVFQLSETKYVTSPGDIYRLHKAALGEYLKHLSWDFSQVNLDGMGEFQDKRPMKLDKIFIDIFVKISDIWRPRDLSSFKEPEEDSKKKNGELIKTVSDLLRKPLPITRLIKDDKLKRIVILGDPGSGKSTIAHFLCLEVSKAYILKKEVKTIPFLVPIRDFLAEKSKRTATYMIENFITDEVESHLRGQCPRGFVNYCLTQMDSVLIFDGLDEGPRLEDREKIRAEIARFTGRFDKAKYIITSRLVGYEQSALDMNQFLHVELQPLDIGQIRQFVIDWYQEREYEPKNRQTRTESFLKALEVKEVGQLATNPLLLTIMALVHKAEADLPKQRALLYEKCVEAFLANRDRTKDLLSYNELEIRLCHEYLGYWMHSKAQKEQTMQTKVSIMEITEKLMELFGHDKSLPLSAQQKKVEEFLDVARRRVGLIVERGQGIFAFGHRSFQEYFAASYLTSSNYGINQLWNSCEKILDPYWHEVILLVAGRLGFTCIQGLNELITKVLENKPEKENLLLASDIAIDKAPVARDLLTKISDRLLDGMLDKDHNYVWRLADLLDTQVREHILYRIREASIDIQYGRSMYETFMLVRWGKNPLSSNMMMLLKEWGRGIQIDL